MAKNFLDQFKAARRVATPLIGVTTPDPAATIATITTAVNGVPVLAWDAIRGIRPVNAGGLEVGFLLIGSQPSADPDDERRMRQELTLQSQNPVEALQVAERLPAKSVLFVQNANRVLEAAGALPALQAVWNLRDAFKANKRTLVLLGPSLTLPPELSGDVIAYDEPLPDGERLRAIVADVYRSARLDPPASDVEARAVDALSGLSAFTAEQVTAMSLTPTGLDLDALWDRKRNAIEQTRGLSVYRGTETFADVEGCDAAKDELRRKIDGRLRPGAIVFIDEVEKALGGLGAAGGAGDSSGTTQDQLGQLLAYMQDRDVAGFLFLGHPGAAKSALAKAAGNEAGIPTIQFDLGGMKGSLVGESEARIREALKVVTAVSNGRPLIIATCNSVANLPPELMRRFTTTYFFDLPTTEERARIWALYRRKFELPAADPLPSDEGWTGAEIRRCAMKAWEYGLPLRQAATYVIPLARSAADRIERLRNEASGRYRSAYTGEPYRYAKDITPATSATVTGRAIEFEEA